MITKTALLIVSLCAATAIGGCTSTITKWSHPSASEDQWAVDKANCRSRARRLAEKEFAAESYGGPAREDEFTSAYSKNMQAYDSKRRRQSLYESCLKRLGYAPSKSAK